MSVLALLGDAGLGGRREHRGRHDDGRPQESDILGNQGFMWVYVSSKGTRQDHGEVRRV
jgi:hypothetical protein